MNLDVAINLAEAAQILREQLALKLNVKPEEIGDVAITSYNKPRVIFGADGIFASIETRHRY